LHGWPELSISWRHQLACFGALGFRAIAPNMRGYGRSSVYTRHEDYAIEHSVQDMLDLLDNLRVDKAIWVGHDWGSSVVWSLASHHPDRCFGVASLCVPYIAQGFTLEHIVPLVDRTVYPERQYPYGKWEYMGFYEENFEKARSDFEADIPKVVKALFRAGRPEGRGQPSLSALVRNQGAWFPTGIPDLPIDTSLLTEEDFHTYAAEFERNGFFGPDSWYMVAQAA
jgi:pimeloyl-ACP methyl ester carboxylesterase